MVVVSLALISTAREAEPGAATSNVTKVSLLPKRISSASVTHEVVNNVATATTKRDSFFIVYVIKKLITFLLLFFIVCATIFSCE